jgi:thiaminase/transcriptional activator TenA
MNFTGYLRKIAQPIWDAQFNHPFVLALGDGSLPPEKFKFYILQDSLFLFELSKVFAAAVQKSVDADTMEKFAGFTSDTIEVERLLHKEYGKLWNMSEAEMAAFPMAPTNYAYTRHMLHIAETGTLAETTAVALPCAWIYVEVGHLLTRKASPSPSHPYRKWLSFYSSPEFAEVAAWMRDKIDLWAETAGTDEKLRMESHFVISSRYEWMFWEMAWKEEKWPV